MKVAIPAVPRGVTAHEMGLVTLIIEGDGEANDSRVILKPGHSSGDFERALTLAEREYGLVFDPELDPDHQDDGAIVVYLLPEED